MDSVGRYDLLLELWPSAIGTRWVARAQSDEAGPPLALQRIPSRMTERSLGELRELGTLAMRLKHPRIGSVLDLVISEQASAIVSAYVPGVSLRSLLGLARLSRAPISPPTAFRVALDLLEALDAVEKSDAVMGGAVSALHGGVTPDAGLVSVEGHTDLADAGLQAIVADGSGAWRHPDLLSYRAPEQLEPEPSASARTDVYAVGVLLWEMLANRALFGASITRARTVRPTPAPIEKGLWADGWLADDVDAIHARQNVIERIQFARVARLDDPDLSAVSVSRSLADIVDCAIARDPAARFACPADLAQAIYGLGEAVATHAEIAQTLEHLFGRLLRARHSAVDDRSSSIPTSQ